MEHCFTSLGAFRWARDDSTGELPGLSKIVYGGGNLILAKPELLSCLAVKPCQAFCSCCVYQNHFRTLPSNTFIFSLMFSANYSTWLRTLLLFHDTMYHRESSVFLTGLCAKSQTTSLKSREEYLDLD